MNWLVQRLEADGEPRKQTHAAGPLGLPLTIIVPVATLAEGNKLPNTARLNHGLVG